MGLKLYKTIIASIGCMIFFKKSIDIHWDVLNYTINENNNHDESITTEIGHVYNNVNNNNLKNTTITTVNANLNAATNTIINHIIDHDPDNETSTTIMQKESDNNNEIMINNKNGTIIAPSDMIITNTSSSSAAEKATATPTAPMRAADKEGTTPLEENKIAPSNLRQQQEIMQQINNDYSNATTITDNSSQYAYAYVIGGCNPDHASKYRGYLYNILVSTKILRELGSAADIVVFIQLTHSYTKSKSLPDIDSNMLKRMNISIYYIPSSETESFYEIQLSKFRIITLTQYKRVLFMDGDVMPLGNLDYIFELSNNGIIKENLVIAGPYEPANGGFFMLSPSVGDYDKINDIIRIREERTLQLGGYDFDHVWGWGHIIQPPDKWRSRRYDGTNWTFHAAFADQGLLYYWTKYVKRNVSIVFGDTIENWSSNSDVILNGTKKEQYTVESVLNKPFAGHSKPVFYWRNACNKFLCDFHHFTGSDKPWLKKPPPAIIAADDEKEKIPDNPFDLWWDFLRKVDHELDLNLNFDKWKTGQRPSLGMYPIKNDIRKRLIHQGLLNDTIS